VWQKLLWLAVLGALGTLARYGLGGFVQQWTDKLFPWGTVAVNLFGCLLFGVIWSSLEERWPGSGQMRTIILIGFLGALTTFSSYVFELDAMLRNAQWLPALGYFTIHNLGGLAAMIAGLALGRLI
jgi:fluoride exporter